MGNFNLFDCFLKTKNVNIINKEKNHLEKCSNQ